MRRLLIAMAVVGLSLATQKAASAGAFVAGDLNLVKPVAGLPSGTGGGWGATGRVGYQTESEVRFSVELGANYTAFGHALFSTGSPSVARGLFGARLSFGEFLAPGVYGHIGAGGVEGTHPGSTSRNWGTTYDAGLSLDVIATSFLTAGLHLEYDWLNAQTPADHLRWWLGGAHVRVGF